METWLIAGVAAAFAVAVASTRVLQEHERAAVHRLDRLVGVRGPGLVMLAPGLERITTLSLRPVRLGPQPVRATTRDGVPVDVHLTVACRVTDVEMAARDGADPLVATLEEAEAVLGKELSHTDLASVAVGRVRLGEQVRLTLDLVAACWGVQVLEVEVEHAEVELTDDLLHWAQQRWPHRDVGNAGPLGPP